MTTTPHPLIRPETLHDTAAIEAVTVAAFREALTVSLVAERGGEVVGHAAASPVTLSDGTPDWFGLGPVLVLPA